MGERDRLRPGCFVVVTGPSGSPGSAPHGGSSPHRGSAPERGPATERGPAAEVDTVFRLAFDPDFAPLSHLDEHGRPAGRALEIVRTAAAVSGVAIEFVAVSLGDEASQLETGSVDGLACAAVTPERAALYDFSAPYLHTAASLFRLAEPERPGGPGTAGRPATVATPAGGPLAAALRAERPGMGVVPVAGYAEALEAVIGGAADAAALNAEVGGHLTATRYPGRFLPPGPSIMDLSLAVAALRGSDRGRALLGRLDLGLSHSRVAATPPG